MNNNTALDRDAEVVDFQEVIRAKASGSGGGFDYFPGMEVGTKFLVIPNGSHGSQCTEFKLEMKLGVSVLLWNVETEGYERHLSQKFWQVYTLVQILHIPNKDNNDGNSVPD